jgi:transcriptional regulator with XRE-family HTH domain
MEQPPNLLAQARKRQGWSQENAIARFEKLGHAMGIAIAARSSLRTLFSMFENGRRPVPEAYRPVFCELYRSTEEELGIVAAESQRSLPVPPPLPAKSPEGPSSDILDYLTNVLAEYIKADALLGPRYLVPTVQSQLPIISRLYQTSRGVDRGQVLLVGARFAQFCGWLYQDAGDPAAANYWTSQALDYAIELNDAQLVAYVLMRKSNIATEAGTPGHGLGLANAALNYSEVLTPRVRAVCLRQKANAHALLSEQRDFEDAIDQALREASDGLTQAVSDLASYCTPSYIEMELGMSRLMLGQAGVAAETFEHSLHDWSGDTQTRDRGVCLARLSAASASIGNIERACEAGELAVKIARATGSARVRAHLMMASEVLKVANIDSAVQEFRANVAALNHDGE